MLIAHGFARLQGLIDVSDDVAAVGREGDISRKGILLCGGSGRHRRFDRKITACAPFANGGYLPLTD